MRYRIMEVEQKKKPGSVLKQNTQGAVPVQRSTTSQLQMDMMATQASLGNRYVQLMVNSTRKVSSGRIRQDAAFLTDIETQGQSLFRKAALADGDAQVDEQTEAAIRQAHGSGNPIPKSIREGMEQALGADFSGVRLHDGTQADQLNRELNSRAFTTGQDIFFRWGEYQPTSLSGRELLAHELAHVVQQSSGRVSGCYSGMFLRPADDVFEQEADALAQQIRIETENLIHPQPYQINPANSVSGNIPAISRENKPTGVIQRSKYEDVKTKAMTDADNENYDYPSVTEADILAATAELVREYLPDIDHEGGARKIIESPNPQISTSWGGAPGIVLLPNKVKAISEIISREFIPNLLHELGHMVKLGRLTDALLGEMTKKIKEEAAEAKFEVVNHRDASPNSDDWEEEVRADLTGVYLRWMKEKKELPMGDYKQGTLKDEPADVSHPPGNYRIDKIVRFIEYLNTTVQIR